LISLSLNKDFSRITSFGDNLYISVFNKSKLSNSHVFHLLSHISKKLIQYLLSIFIIDNIKLEEVLVHSYHSHSRLSVAGVTTLTTSLFTIHLSVGSDICSTIATLYQAFTKIGRYFSLA